MRPNFLNRLAARLAPADFSLQGVLRVPPAPRGLVLIAAAHAERSGDGHLHGSQRLRRIALQFKSQAWATCAIDLGQPVSPPWVTGEPASVRLTRWPRSMRSHPRSGARTPWGAAPGREDAMACAAAIRESRRSARRQAVLDRLTVTVDWLHEIEGLQHLPIILVGIDRAAAAALQFSLQRSEQVLSVVCCGGRRAMAEVDLPTIRVPTLLVAPDRHPLVQTALDTFLTLRCPSELTVVRGATQVFNRPIEELTGQRAIRDWCHRQLQTV